MQPFQMAGWNRESFTRPEPSKRAYLIPKQIQFLKDRFQDASQQQQEDEEDIARSNPGLQGSLPGPPRQAEDILDGFMAFRERSGRQAYRA
jgi:hypothetical protein